MRALQLLLPAGAWVGVARSPSGRGAVYLQPQRYPCALVSIRGDGHTAAQLPGRGAKPIRLSVMQTITDRLLGLRSETPQGRHGAPAHSMALVSGELGNKPWASIQAKNWLTTGLAWV